MRGAAARPRMLLVGGGGGLVRRAIVAEFAPDWEIVSVHRHPIPNEAAAGVRWVAADVARVPRWDELLRGVDLVVNVAWLRSGGEREFAPLAEGLLRLIGAARESRPRFVHISVPDAPIELETGLPYLSHKRRVDRALLASDLPFLIVRPTLLFGPGDRLLTVMLRTMRRYRFFPVFGDGGYHVSPLASADLARIVRRELEGPPGRNLALGGPERWRYRDLTDRMFQLLGQRPRYWHLSEGGARRLTRTLERFGSSLLYEYEVVWLLSDMLGLPAYSGPALPLAPVGPFLEREAERLLRGTRGRTPPRPTAPGRDRRLE